VNLKQAAARLGVHYQTAYRWVRSGELTAIRVGARYEVSDAAIHRFLATRQSVLRQSEPQNEVGHHSRSDPDVALQDLEAMASDSLISAPALTSFAARRGREALGDLSIVAVTGPDGTIEWAALDHAFASRAAFVASALSIQGPMPPRPNALVAPVLASGAVVRIPHVPQDRLRAGLRPELRQYLDDNPVMGLLAAPIRIDGVIRGMVAFTRDTPADPYTVDDEEFAVRFADRVGALVKAATEIEDAWSVREDLAVRFRAALTQLPFGASLDPSRVHGILDRADVALPVVVFDGDARIIGANRAMEQSTGFDRDALVGRTFDDYIEPDDAELERSNFARLASGELDYHDYPAGRRSSSGAPLEVALHRVAVRRLDSSLACVISVWRPVHVSPRIKDLIGAP
jgi:excisionase family DNA binding protein/PAS domain S-box-containing protein